MLPEEDSSLQPTKKTSEEALTQARIADVEDAIVEAHALRDAQRKQPLTTSKQ